MKWTKHRIFASGFVRELSINGTSGLAAKAISFFSVFTVSHLLYRSWTPELFGYFSTLQALSLVMTFADFGIGANFVNQIVNASESNNRDSMRRMISELARVYLNAAIYLVLAFAAIALVVAARIAYGAKATDASPAVGALVFFVGVSYGMQLILSIPVRTNFALGKNYRNHLFNGVSAILQVIVAFVCVKLGVGFYVAALLILFCPVVAFAINFVATFRLWEVDLNPYWISDLNLAKYYREGKGYSYLIVQIGSMLAFSMDAPFLSSVAGPAVTAIFAVNQRIYSIVNQISDPFLQMLWPKFQAASHSKDKILFRKILLYGIGVVSFFSILVLVLLSVFYDAIILKLFSSEACLGNLERLGFALWALAGGVGGVVSAAMLTSKFIKAQASIMICACVASVLLKIYGAIFNLGLGWVVWTNGLVTLVIVCGGGLYYLNKNEI